MSGAFDEIGDFITRPIKSIGKRLGLVPPKTPELPKPPTIDEARQNQDEFDRLRRRRGVLSNIFTSGSGGSATVGTKSLLGE